MRHTTIGALIEHLQQFPPTFEVYFCANDALDCTRAHQVTIDEGPTFDGPGSVTFALLDDDDRLIGRCDYCGENFTPVDVCCERRREYIELHNAGRAPQTIYDNGQIERAYTGKLRPIYRAIPGCSTYDLIIPRNGDMLMQHGQPGGEAWELTHIAARGFWHPATAEQREQKRTGPVVDCTPDLTMTPEQQMVRRYRARYPEIANAQAMSSAFYNAVSAAREVWMQENPGEDGRDHVTPFDQFLYGGKIERRTGEGT